MVRAHVKQLTDSKSTQLPPFLKRRDQKYYRGGHGPSPVPNKSARKTALISAEGERDNRTVVKTGAGPRSHNQRPVVFLNKGVFFGSLFPNKVFCSLLCLSGIIPTLPFHHVLRDMDTALTKLEKNCYFGEDFFQNCRSPQEKHRRPGSIL